MKFNTSQSQFVRFGSATILFALSLCAPPAWATCDPNNIKHMPCPAPATNHSSIAAQRYFGPKAAGSTSRPRQPSTYTAAKKPAIGPLPPGPLHASQSATPSNTHSIIFVGGKPTNNKAALNPQPIPPGVPARPLDHSH